MLRFFTSLRFRLIALVSAALLPTVGVMIYNGLDERREARLEAENHLRQLVAQVAREQEQKTITARHLLMGLGQVPAVRRQEAAACSALFARVIAKPSLFANIGAVDRDGNIFASALPMSKPLNAKHLPYFQRALQTRDFAIGDLQYGRIVLKPVLIFAYPVLDAAGQVQTVLYASVSLDWLNDLATQARLPAGSVLGISDEQGAIMARHPHPELWTGKSWPKGSLIDTMQKLGQGIGEAKGMDGIPRVYAFTPLGREPRLGFVYAGIPTEVVYAVVRQALSRNLAALGGTLLLALLLAAGFGHLFIMRRVKALMQATRQMARGDLSVRTGLAGGSGEFAQLGQDFDRMAASLEEREADRQQAEEAIRDGARKWQVTFDAINDAVCLIDMHGKILQANETMALLLQKPPSEIVGQTCWKLMHGTTGPIEGCPITRLRQSLTRESLILPLGDRWFNVVADPILNEAGALVGAVHIISDITARKEAEREVERLASFPRFNPNPVIEVNLAGEITFGNPASHEAFQRAGGLDLREFLPEDLGDILAAFLQDEGKKFYREVKIKDTVFGENIHFVSQFQVARIFGMDITARKQAEERLKNQMHFVATLLETIPSPVFYKDTAGRYLGCNRAFEAFFGKTRAEIIGKEVSDMGPREIAEKYARMDQELFDRPGTQMYEWKVRVADGSEREVIFNKATFLDTGGQVAGLIGVMLDITERKQTEKALRESEERLRLFIEHAPASLAMFDKQMRYLSASRRWLTDYNLGDRNLLGLSHYEVFPEIPERWKEFHRRGLAGEVVRSESDRFERLDGSVQWLRWEVRPWYDASGGVGGIVIFSEDITARKQAEAALRESEELYRSLFDNMLNGFAYFKMLFEDNQPQDLIFLSVNRSFEPLTGLKNVVGKKVSQVIPGMREADPELFKFFGRVALTGQPERLEIYVTSLEKWFSISAYSPAKEYFVTVFDVITARKQAEEALCQRVTDLAALYAASQVFLGQIGVSETLEAACRLAGEHFKVKMAWAGLKLASDYRVYPAAVWGFEDGYLSAIQVTWDDSPTGRGPTGTAIRTGQAMVMNRIDTDPRFAPWRDQALARGYCSSAAVPLRLGEEVVGALNIYSDQPDYFQADRVQVFEAFANQAATAMQKARLYEETQRYAGELEQRVARRTAELQEINTELEGFAYSISHDLRAPLRAMEGFSQALLEDYAPQLDATAQDFARRIVAAARRMDLLIRDLLAYSRLSRAEMRFRREDLGQVVAEARSQLELEIQEKQARVEMDALFPTVMAHHSTLVQVVANLLANALKFVAPGVAPRVRLWAEEQGDWVRLWVEDNGIGIAQAHLERIFRIFERLHGVETYPGTGIGLAIVRKGVERMGGRVGVESEPGRGSKFWVELPKAQGK